MGIQKALCQFLLKYRSTPHPSTGETPSKLMFGREIRTRLHMLHPNEMEKPRQQETAKALTRTFKANDPVWVQNYTGKPKWLAGKIVAETGPVSYKVRVQGQIQRRHVDQLKKRHVDVELTSHPDNSNDSFLLFPSPQSGTEQLTTTRRYPARENRKPPEDPLRGIEIETGGVLCLCNDFDYVM